MENASKALTMAGGILIALMIVSLLIYMFNQLGKSANEEDKAEVIQQIVEFNLQYETYDRKDVYGAELVSLINKINDYNKRESEEKGYLKMDMEVKFSLDIDGYFIRGSRSNAEQLKTKIQQVEKMQEENEKEAKQSGIVLLEKPFSDFKRKLFKCTKIEYDEDNGRITKMYFEEVDPTKNT